MSGHHLHLPLPLNQSTGDRVLVIRRDTTNGRNNFSFHDKSLVESHEHHDVPEQLRSLEVEFVGSYDGLICFCKRDIMRDNTFRTVHSFLIWNPTITKLVELPPCYSPPFERLTYLLGFGFDSESRDYKVARVVYPLTYGSNPQVVAKSDLFDMQRGVWRSSSSPTLPLYFRNTCVYFCGNFHWIGNDVTITTFILSFNSSSEVLQEMETVPETRGTVEGYRSIDTNVVALNGLLSLAVLKEKRQGGVLQYCISVWSMKEYGVSESWTKLFNIELPHTTKGFRFERLFENGELLLVEQSRFRAGGNSAQGFRFERLFENGELLLVEQSRFRAGGNSALVLYKPGSRTCRTLVSTDGSILKVCFYKESSVLV